MEYSSVSDNLKYVNEKIENARQRSKRDTKVNLLAVTKRISNNKILDAIKAGHKLFGENYIQEALKKITEFSSHSIEWHFIGGLQSNKAKYCFDNFSMIQTVDRESIANALNKEAQKRDISGLPVLIEVNLAGEASKSGISADKLIDFINKVSSFEGIKIKGLMSIPPYFEKAEDSRPYFIRLRQLRDKIREKNIAGIEMDELSMGMSNDYEVAIEEGATIVRVGTAIFGPRD